MIVLQSVNEYKLFNCKANDAGRRLDRVIKIMLPDVPAGLIYSGIRKGLIRVNGKKIKQSYRINEDDVIQVKETINFKSGSKHSSDKDLKVSDKLNQQIVLRTENLVFFNKPAGLLTHGPESLAEMLTTGLAGVSESLSFTPAPLHRLDRNTSGLIAVSLTINGATRFSELMREHNIDKYYIGICLNGPESSQRLENNLVRNDKITKIKPNANTENRKAVTVVKPLLNNGKFSLCLFRIETGLTHQIRAQAAAAGYPLAGDNKYGGRITGFKGYFLHSFSMSLPAYDKICGFKTVSADMPPRAMKKASELFGRESVDEAIQSINSEIIH